MKTLPSRRPPLLVALLALTACLQAPWRIVPVQVGRVVQMERYEQTPVRIKQADDTYGKLLGAQNWKALKGLHVSLLDDFEKKKIVVEGSFVMVAYPTPESPSEVTIEASGGYRLVRKDGGREREILLSGEFTLNPEAISIEQLRSGCIDVSVSITTTSIPGAEKTYQHTPKDPLRYRFYITRITNDLLTFDYTKDHRVSVGQKPIALLKLKSPPTPLTHVIDLRGLEFLRQDYASLYEQSRAGRTDVAKKAESPVSARPLVDCTK